MKRTIILFLAAVLLPGLCACGRSDVSASEPFVPVSAAAEVPVESTPEALPALSPGAAEKVYRAGCFGTGADGALYTSLSRADGLVCLYDVLPEDIGYVARFLITDEGIYAAVKSEYFTPEPAALFFFPAGGEPKPLADNVTSDGMFLMTDDALFYADADGGLRRLTLGADSAETVLDGAVRLLDADGGFICYAKDDGVYRNDSTMDAETLLFSPASLSVRAGGGMFYSLSYRADGSTHIELRGPDGSIRTDVPLEEETDNFIAAGGLLYVPQPAGGRVLILDAATGDLVDEIPLFSVGAYCLLLYADGETVYYETALDGETVLYRADKDAAEDLGPELLF